MFQKKKIMMMINLNLKMNNQRWIVFIYVLMISLSSSYAQKRTKWSVTSYLGVSNTSSFLKSESNTTLPGLTQTYARYADSVNDKYASRISYSGGIGFRYGMNKNIDIVTGIQYTDIGFASKLRNIQYAQIIFPGLGNALGIVMDKTNLSKNADLNYRFQYIQIPIILSKKVGSSRDFNWEWDVFGGIAANVLLKHDLQVKLLDNYNVEGKNVFQFDSTGYKARAFTWNVMAGFTAFYKYTNTVRVYASPYLSFYPMSITGNEIQVKTFQGGIQIGIQKLLKN